MTVHQVHQVHLQPKTYSVSIGVFMGTLYSNTPIWKVMHFHALDALNALFVLAEAAE